METINAFTVTGLPRIIFGHGAVSGLPGIIRSYGPRVLIITGGKSLKNSGRWDALAGELHSAGLRTRTVSVQGEPTTELIDTITGEYRKMPVDVVCAIGGGSVIDCGKAVSAMLVQKGSVKDYLEDVGTQKPSGVKVPFIAVPTTSGTGSETTKNAVVSDRKAGYKKSLRHDAYMPDVALVDPDLTLSLSAPLTIASGLDAVSQLIESYTSTRANVLTDPLAMKALALASEAILPLASGQTDDLSLRERMSYAAMISGITLGHAGLGAVHGLAGPLGGFVRVPHGVACGKLLFPTMTFVIKRIVDENNIAAQMRFADIGRLFAGEKGGDNLFYCRQFLGVLHQWTEALKLPQLSAFGMTDADMAKTIAVADSKNSPAVLSREEMKVILETVR